MEGKSAAPGVDRKAKGGGAKGALELTTSHVLAKELDAILGRIASSEDRALSVNTTQQPRLSRPGRWHAPRRGSIADCNVSLFADISVSLFTDINVSLFTGACLRS
jgi:hypothetical protein